MKLYAFYGATEFGAPSLLVHAGERIPWYPETSDGVAAHSDATKEPNGVELDVKAPEDWSWITLAPQVKPRWVPQGDGSYELQILVRRFATEVHLREC